MVFTALFTSTHGVLCDVMLCYMQAGLIRAMASSHWSQFFTDSVNRYIFFFFKKVLELERKMNWALTLTVWTPSKTLTFNMNGIETHIQPLLSRVKVIFLWGSFYCEIFSQNVSCQEFDISSPSKLNIFFHWYNLKSKVGLKVLTDLKGHAESTACCKNFAKQKHRGKKTVQCGGTFSSKRFMKLD